MVGKESTSVQTETTVPKFSNRTSQRMQTAAVTTDTHTEDTCPGGRAAAHVSLTGALTSLLRREDRPHRHTASRLQEFTPKCGAVGGCIVTPHPKQTQDTGTVVGEQRPDGSADQSAPPPGDAAPPPGRHGPAHGRHGPAHGRHDPPPGDAAPPMGDKSRPRETRPRPRETRPRPWET